MMAVDVRIGSNDDSFSESSKSSPRFSPEGLLGFRWARLVSYNTAETPIIELSQVVKPQIESFSIIRFCSVAGEVVGNH